MRLRNQRAGQMLGALRPVDAKADQEGDDQGDAGAEKQGAVEVIGGARRRDD
jgi:hypothetical protein